MATLARKRRGPAPQRLLDRRDFLRFFEGSEVFRLSQCTIFRVANTLGHYRLGITLKVRALSVERNRVRRVVREAFRVKRADLGSFDYNVVIGGRPEKKLGHPYPLRLRESLGEEFSRALERGGARATPKAKRLPEEKAGEEK